MSIPLLLGRADVQPGRMSANRLRLQPVDATPKLPLTEIELNCRLVAHNGRSSRVKRLDSKNHRSSNQMSALKRDLELVGVFAVVVSAVAFSSVDRSRPYGAHHSCGR